MLLTLADRRRLLDIARRALEARVRGVMLGVPDSPLQPDVVSGAFVSVHRCGQLRGCLGRLDGEWSLTHLVADLGAAVADSDPRFEAVSVHELAEIAIEISVLTPVTAVASPDEIYVGRHGVVVEKGGRRGLLLPQVAAERGWDRHTLLEHVCLKAGLPREAWRDGARLLVFEAQVFSEEAEG